MQNDRLRDFLKFFRYHLAWFILSAGFFAVILISGIFLSTKYVVDTANQANQLPEATPELMVVASPQPTATPTIQPTVELTSTVQPTATPQLTAAPQPSVQPDFEQSTYLVKSGDTLWAISEQTYGTGYLYIVIARENNLSNADSITAGQTLRLPQIKDHEKPNNVQEGVITDTAWSEDNTAYIDYTIEKGDSLWLIAEQELGNPLRWREIYQVNKAVIGDNPDLIYPNVTIQIPTDQQATSGTSGLTIETSTLLQ